MRELGWSCTALDPDPRATDQALIHAEVEAICADFTADSVDGFWDVITFNKVLEHVVDPVAMLARSIELLTGRGFVYIELPDAEAALAVGPWREEFFVEHYHAFSAASTALLAHQAGLRVDQLARVHEPSDKFTLRGVLTT
jgi:2-polyprenyl-3-methyl-5-hydroxy-6-metoxy-1,4-benzoquinol methylase